MRNPFRRQPLPVVDVAVGMEEHDRLLACLTPRELEVVLCVGRGLTGKEIAHELGISADTVKSHIGRAHVKLDVDSSIDMLRVLGLVHVPAVAEMAVLVDVARIRTHLADVRAELAEIEARAAGLGVVPA